MPGSTSIGRRLGQLQTYGGYLYAIGAPMVDRVKIGVAADPAVRMTTLRTASPVPLVLCSATWHRDPLAVERAAHARLGHARLHGEWFDALDIEVGAWLASRPRHQEGAPRGLTIPETAERLETNEDVVRQWIRTGRLRAWPYGEQTYIAPIDIERLRLSTEPVAAVAPTGPVS